MSDEELPEFDWDAERLNYEDSIRDPQWEAGTEAQRRASALCHDLCTKRAWDTIEMFQSLYGSTALNEKLRTVIELGIEGGYVGTIKTLHELGLLKTEDE